MGGTGGSANLQKEPVASQGVSGTYLLGHSCQGSFLTISVKGLRDRTVSGALGLTMCL